MVAIARTVCKIKPGQWDALREYGFSIQSRVLSIPGLISWGWAETGDDESTTIAVYKDREAAAAAAPVVTEIFAGLASMIAAPPERVLLDGEWFTE